MMGQLVWERVIAEALTPKALALGDTSVAGEVLGRAGRTGCGARVCWMSQEVGIGDEMWWATEAELEADEEHELEPAVFPKKNERERARRMGDLVTCAATVLLGLAGLRGGVSASRSWAWRAEEETKVGEETKRDELEADGVTGEGDVQRK